MGTGVAGSRRAGGERCSSHSGPQKGHKKLYVATTAINLQVENYFADKSIVGRGARLMGT